MTLSYGSLFSGIGGLDLAVEEVFEARAVFHSEVDKNPSTVLAKHWPGVPNLGDITQIDWEEVPPVDILCGGFPCQDISSAGARAGIMEGTRSGLWFRYADAIRVLRPRLVVVENVGALLVRGLDIVLGSLAEIGYDARWTCLRASDIGAPHRRERVFLIAWPSGDTPDLRRPRTRHEGRGRDHQGEVGSSDIPDPHSDSERFPRPLPEPQRNHGRGHQGSSPDPEITEWGGPQQQGLGAPAGPAPEPGEHPRATPDADGWGPQEREERYGQAEQDPANGSPCRSNPDGPIRDSTRGRSEGASPDPGGERHGGGQDGGEVGGVPVEREGQGLQRERPRELTRDRGAEIQWGKYEPAIRRWESLTRPAPSPVTPEGRLSPHLTEWMMGFPEGWVADVLDRNPALKACGNAVVPAQAVEGIRRLLAADITQNPSGESITFPLDRSRNPYYN